MKVKVYKFAFFFVFFWLSICQDEGGDGGGEGGDGEEGASAANYNIYKYDNKVKHSLFKEQNGWDRISYAQTGIPPRKKF